MSTSAEVAMSYHKYLHFIAIAFMPMKHTQFYFNFINNLSKFLELPKPQRLFNPLYAKGIFQILIL